MGFLRGKTRRGSVCQWSGLSVFRLAQRRSGSERSGLGSNFRSSALTRMVPLVLWTPSVSFQRSQRRSTKSTSGSPSRSCARRVPRPQGDGTRTSRLLVTVFSSTPRPACSSNSRSSILPRPFLLSGR